MSLSMDVSVLVSSLFVSFSEWIVGSCFASCFFPHTEIACKEGIQGTKFIHVLVVPSFPGLNLRVTLVSEIKTL